MKIKVSIIIPTHNPRRDYLSRTLEALAAQTLDREKWELVVIDNASEEAVDLCESAKVGRLEGVACGGSRVAGFRGKGAAGYGLQATEADGSPSSISHLPSPLNVRVVREDKLGLTHARVRGFEEAKGEIVVMVDDDNVLRPDYLEKAVEIMDRNPLLGAIGGKALPEYEIEPPEWLKGIRSGLGLRDLGNSIIPYPDINKQGEAEKGIGGCGLGIGGKRSEEQGEVEGERWKVEGEQRSEVGGQRSEGRQKKAESENRKAETGRVRRKMTEFPDCAPIGAGMVMRREAAMEYVEDLKRRSRVVTDRKGKSLSSGGDNDICLTVLEHGWRVGYFPKLELTHLISRERMTVDYQCRMARDAMRSFIVMLDQHGIRPWPAMAGWTLPVKTIRSWWRTKPWKGVRERLSFENAMGQFLGRADIGAER